MSEELENTETKCEENSNKPGTYWHEDKIKTLEMIQNIISRLANNSFALKNLIAVLITAKLSITNIGLFIIFKDNKSNITFALVVIAIWLLDSYYLQLERKYRNLFNYTRCKSVEYVYFDLNTNNGDIKNNLSEKDKERIVNDSFGKCFTSKCEIVFYISMLILALVG